MLAGGAGPTGSTMPQVTTARSRSAKQTGRWAKVGNGISRGCTSAIDNLAGAKRRGHGRAWPDRTPSLERSPASSRRAEETAVYFSDHRRSRNLLRSFGGEG